MRTRLPYCRSQQEQRHELVVRPVERADDEGVTPFGGCFDTHMGLAVRKAPHRGRDAVQGKPDGQVVGKRLVARHRDHHGLHAMTSSVSVTTGWVSR